MPEQPQQRPSHNPAAPAATRRLSKVSVRSPRVVEQQTAALEARKKAEQAAKQREEERARQRKEDHDRWEAATHSPEYRDEPSDEDYEATAGRARQINEDPQVVDLRDRAQATLKRASTYLQLGSPERALQALQPLLDELHELETTGADAPAGAYDFDQTELAYLYFLQHPEVDMAGVRPAVGPHVDAHGYEGAILYQLGRFDESVAALDKALRWAPSDAGLYLERAMAHEAMGDVPALADDIQQAYPLIIDPVDLARYHAFRADVLTARHAFELAAAHFAVYRDFDPDDTYAEPQAELRELGKAVGNAGAFTSMGSVEARQRLARGKEPYGPSALAVQALTTLLMDDVEAGDFDGARDVTRRLYALSHEEDLRQVMDMIDQQQAQTKAE